MALLIPPMSAVPHLQSHMTDSHEKSASPGFPNHSTNVAIQPNNKRPRLSLQTTSLANTYGVLTRGLASSSETQATYTPTTTNTLANTWDLSVRPSPVSRTESPKPPPIRAPTPQHPYTVSLPFGIKSILKNSPLPPKQSSISASPRDPKRKIFFPQPKRVVFKRNLEDLIETTHYVARHSDLASSTSEESSGEEEEGDQADASSLSLGPEIGASGSQASPPPSRKRKSRRDIGTQIETNVEQEEQRSHDGGARTSAATPSKDRKRRKWPCDLASQVADESGVQNDAQTNDDRDGNDATIEGNTCPQLPSETTAESDQPCATSSPDSHAAPKADSDVLAEFDDALERARSAAGPALEPS